MRRFNPFFLLMLFVGPCYSQSHTDKLHLLEVKFGFLSFNTSGSGVQDLKPVVGFEYQGPLSPRTSLSVGTTAGFGEAFGKQQSVVQQKRVLLLSELLFNYRISKKAGVVQPYLTGGIACSYFDDRIGLSVPLGIGTGIFLTPDIRLNLAARYRIEIAGLDGGQFLFCFGLGGVIGRRKIAKPSIVAPVKDLPKNVQIDSDGDGILDIDDECPSTPGILAFKGCPDRDNDGIQDRLDECPSVFGIQKYRGCPIPDRDGDGINDERDSCISVPGIAARNGCPEINQTLIALSDAVAQNIFFETGSAKLTSKSKQILKDFAVELRKDSLVKLNIDGHTDNVGESQKNLQLSVARAASVAEELTANGIAQQRLTSNGFGDSKPIDTNLTAAGRQRNRRVEITLRY